jgi:Na+/H+-dicarboxylate symporter
MIDYFFQFKKYYKLNKEIDWFASPSERNGLNVLGLVMFCLIFGIIISTMDKRGKILIDFFECINEAFSKLIGIVMM